MIPLREPVTAYLGLGANIGDREANLRRALESLERSPGIEVDAVSRFVPSKPLTENPPQPDYLNGALRSTL